MSTLARLGHFGWFAGSVAWRIVTPWWEFGEIARQTWAVIARCALPVVSVVFPFGMVIALQGLGIFELFGATRLLSSLVSVAVFREIAPVLASTLVAAQGGSSFAAELGAMRIREELDATEIMAVDSLRAHVVPRVLAALVAAPALNLLGGVAGLLGGYVTAVWLEGLDPAIWWANAYALTRASDVLGGVAKTVVFGGTIGLVACYHGFHATGGAAGVGRAVNDTVVQACTAFIVMNYFLTTALFGAIGA